MTDMRFHLDFETRSLVDLPKQGEHAYARHWSTAPILLTYGAAPKGETPDFELVDFFDHDGYSDSIYPKLRDPRFALFKAPCPPAIEHAAREGFTFVAHNARFEQAIYYYICHGRWGWPMPAKWSCTAARARYYGIRASLAGAASDLEVITQKDERGKTFINDFCKPRKYKGKKADGIVKELWYEPHENPEGWQIGKEYCISDGKAEADVDAILPDLPPFEQAAWEWDFAINTRGVPIDVQSVGRAIHFSNHYTAHAVSRFEDITALRPTQRDKVLEYLQQREEISDLGDLKSKTLKRLVMDDFPADLRDIIQIRLDCSLASIKKLETMIRCTDDDGRARGIHLYGGAHTMRWSAKRVQTQNMKRGSAQVQASTFRFLEDPVWDAPNLPECGPVGFFPRDPVPAWRAHADMLFPRPLMALSQSMRGFIKAPAGRVIRAGDYAQIEARVNAWLARANTKLNNFRQKMDMYVAFASTMYGIPYEDFFEEGPDGRLEVRRALKDKRQVAKSAELGCGFGLGGSKFQQYCDNSDIFIDEATAQRTVDAWREANPEIVQLWSRMEAAAIAAIANPGQVFTLGGTDVKFYTWHFDQERFWLVIELPSGRGLFYYRPKLPLVQRWGRTVEQVTFRKEWNGQSFRESTYGGKITENVVQAIARDVMVVGGLKVEAAGYETIMLVHDELVTLTDANFGSHHELCALMCQQDPWVTDLPIEAEGATMERYGK